jgi:hypothetical protein
MKWMALENRYTTVRMAVLPSDGGRPVTKSMEMPMSMRPGTARLRDGEVGVDQLEFAEDSCSVHRPCKR